MEEVVAPHFTITVSENELEKCIFQLIEHVRPRWDSTRIKTKLLTDGITNKLVLCRTVSDNGIEENILVRIYGNKTDLLIDRKAEIRNIKLLHNHSLAPSLYATFENGLVYEYIPGRTLSTEDVENPAIYRMVAKEMAKMHKVRDPSQNQSKANLWCKMQQFYDLIPDRFDEEIKQRRYENFGFPKELLLKETRDLMRSVSRFDMDVVFCHNDLLLGNIIYNESKDKVYFIDFEYASYNYQPFDIANHFSEYAGVTEIDYSKFPCKELQVDWLKTYLMEYRGVPEVSEEEIENLYRKVNVFVLASHLFWYSWALIQAAHSQIDFDFIGYAAQRIEEYFRRKLTLQKSEASDKL